MTYTTYAKTMGELRDEILGELERREKTCRVAAARPVVRKNHYWELGRADAYRDFAEFLRKLAIPTGG